MLLTVLVMTLGTVGLFIYLVGVKATISAPGDGQTSMCCFPCGFVGMVLGGWSLYKSFSPKIPHWLHIVMLVYALIALASFIRSIHATIVYVHPSRHQPQEDEKQAE